MKNKSVVNVKSSGRNYLLLYTLNIIPKYEIMNFIRVLIYIF